MHSIGNYYESKTLNPYENIAFEKTLFDQCVTDTLYLWVNGPSVIAGINQNIEKEFNFKAVDRYGVNIVRRLTGGGCVYHDEGNLNFTFVIPGETSDFSKEINIIVAALTSLGIDALPSGRNDIVVNNKKISGTAWMVEDGKTLFHGTLLVDVNLEQMVEVLTPSYKKFEGKGIDSVKARVSNLSDINPSITVESLKRAILAAFENEFKTEVIIGEEIQRDIELENKLKSSEFIYTKNMSASLEFEERIAGSLYTISFDLKGGMIVNVEIFTDDLSLERADKLKDHLLNKPYYSYNDLISSFNLLY